MIRHNEIENVSFNEQPYPHDEDYGMCVECGGNKNVILKSKDSKKVKERKKRNKLGWAASTFFEARFGILRSQLSANNQAKFDALSYENKIAIIAQMIEKGYII